MNHTIVKSLHELIGATPGLSPVNFPSNISINNITADSKKCREGSLFVAVRGATETSRDGHDFIEQAIANGASAIVVAENFIGNSSYSVPTVRAADSKLALCHLVEIFFDRPSSQLNVIGITGTNGKTSTSFMLHSILKAAGYVPKIMGTLGMGDPGNLTPLSHTTMAPEFISEQLRTMKDAGATHVIMEVSSHALAQKRVQGLRFAAVGLTNITQDHLDFHKSLEAYREAKAQLFFELSGADTVIALPEDHPFSAEKMLPNRALYFGEQPHCDIGYGSLSFQGLATHFSLRINQTVMNVALPFLGDVHVKNASLAATLAYGLGIPRLAIVEGLKCCPRIPGRLDPVKNRHGLRVFVDFAHTPHALATLLTTVRALPHQRIIVVFGCGGDRDRQKRPLMGQIAQELAHHSIVTDDNPRSEDPSSIRAEILGVRSERANIEEIADREEAIRRAITMAEKSDIVVIAGKGHENYQIFREHQVWFCDHAVAERVLDSL